MSIENLNICFLILFLVNYISLKLRKEYHFNALKLRVFNQFFNLLTYTNLLFGWGVLFSLFFGLLESDNNSFIHLLPMMAFCSYFILRIHRVKIKQHHEFYDITNDLKLKK